MSNYNLRRIKAPAYEPVTVNEVKAHTHIDYSNDDVLIQKWIRSARELIEGYQHVSYVPQQFKLILDDYPKDILYIPMSPVKSIDKIKYNLINNLSIEHPLQYFFVDLYSVPARIVPIFGGGWGDYILCKIGGIEIDYTAGYELYAGVTPGPEEIIECIPEPVKQAIIIYCAWQNGNREGEKEIPEQFYDLIRPGVIYL